MVKINLIERFVSTFQSEEKRRFWPKNGFWPFSNPKKSYFCDMVCNLSLKDRSLKAKDRSLAQKLRFSDLKNLEKIVTGRKGLIFTFEGSILEGIFSVTLFFLQGSIFVERRIDPCVFSLKIVSSSPKHPSLSLDFQSFKFKWPFSTLCSCMIPIEFFST